MVKMTSDICKDRMRFTQQFHSHLLQVQIGELIAILEGGSITDPALVLRLQRVIDNLRQAIVVQIIATRALPQHCQYHSLSRCYSSSMPQR